jgi:hypothetical protein
MLQYAIKVQKYDPELEQRGAEGLVNCAFWLPGSVTDDVWREKQVEATGKFGHRLSPVVHRINKEWKAV